MQWIDALDTKAGVLLAADGVIAGLILSPESTLTTAPIFVAITVAALLLTSLLAAVSSFTARNYEIAPDPTDLVLKMPHYDASELQRATTTTILNAIVVNEPKVARKARYLSLAAGSLLLSVISYGAYFIYLLMR